MGEARNARVKFISIPRLELQAAVLATRLNRMLREELDLCIQDTIYWTDSDIVLHYLKKERRRFQTYVANRVEEIRGNSKPDEWNHASGSLNPTDDVSRGVRTFALIVTAHPYCARKFICHVIHRARALSSKTNNDRADGHCYSFAWI